MIDVMDLVLIALFSGLGNSGGQWVFRRFVEPHLEAYEHRMRLRLQEQQERMNGWRKQ